MVSFRGARKLSSYRLRAKLYPLECSVGPFKCNGRRCQLSMNVTESNTFSSSVYKKEYVINIVLTAMKNALYICSLVISGKCNM